MAHLSNSSWRANAACIACGLLSHIPVDPSMSVNRKVTVPVGGLATTTSMYSLLSLRRNTIAAEHCLGPLFGEEFRRRGSSLRGSCCESWWVIGPLSGANLVAVQSVGRPGAGRGNERP